MEEKETLLESKNQRNNGGFKTMSFIIANASFEKAAAVGLSANMILYLESEYHIDLVTGANIIILWTAASSFLPVLGAFLADSTVGRYPMIAYGSIVGLLGAFLLWLTAIVPQARPPLCSDSTTECDSSTTLQIVFLCFSLGLTSLGAGGIRSASMAFGADQFVKRLNKEESLAALDSYFGWYYAASSLAIVISLTLVAYIQEHLGWAVGFGLPVMFMLLGALSFFSASSLYIRGNDKSSLITGFFQVIVASYRNRHLSSALHKNNVYHHKKESALVVPSEKLRFLNKACVVDPEIFLTANGDILDSWSLCTVDQVEEFKAVLKVIPLWSTGVLLSVVANQISIFFVQAMAMDRHITSSFEIPAASLSVFLFISAISSILLYDRIIVPLASRIMRKPFHLTSKLKMGIGILFSIFTMVAFAFIEYIRRGKAIKQRFTDSPEAVVNMSALWLILPFCLGGISDAINAVGQCEFFYSEFPKSMSSIASSLRELSTSVGGLVATCILNIIDRVTRQKGKPSWISSNINQGHYDYYYLVIACICAGNMLYYLVCSWAYGPCELVAVKASPEEDEFCEE
ncbi:Solute carrier family 15 (Peptide/histidine transporter), member 3/4 [Heracleum sosnowskyi]|uniref:Solute carrier family 15 (Peptide/histidine transporter), member 3/4 n=1 Tax=Heracleum sosnowskyi TaxID=360622 RepID=A0AAD8MCH3_9APIA|nr:Solute carrier family 15 (Peptide/histidine transporter), member 3/4 [Heracleum sosnowskyi]